jgi:hypothetical protein
MEGALPVFGHSSAFTGRREAGGLPSTAGSEPAAARVLIAIAPGPASRDRPRGRHRSISGVYRPAPAAGHSEEVARKEGS